MDRLEGEINPALSGEIEGATDVAYVEGLLSGIKRNTSLTPKQRRVYVSMAEVRKRELLLMNGRRYHGE